MEAKRPATHAFIFGEKKKEAKKEFVVGEERRAKCKATLEKFRGDPKNRKC